MSDLFSQAPYPDTEDVDGETHAALLGDGSPVRHDTETDGQLAAAGVPVADEPGRRRYVPPDRCPSCGVDLPDPNHPVDASLRRG